MKHVSFLLAALVVVLGVHSFTRADPPPGAAKWEYRRIRLYDADYFKEPVRKSQLETLKQEAADEGYDLAARREESKALAVAGRDGWELVQEIPGSGGGDSWFVLKRPLK